MYGGINRGDEIQAVVWTGGKWTGAGSVVAFVLKPNPSVCHDCVNFP